MEYLVIIVPVALMLFLVAYSRPFVGLCLLSAAFPFERISVAEDVTIVVPVGALVVSAWVLRSFGKSIYLGKEFFAAIAMFALSLVSMYLTGEYSTRIQSVFQALILIVFVSNVVVSLRQVSALIVIAAIALIVPSIPQLFSFVINSVMADARYSGVFFDPNYYSLYCIALLPGLIAVTFAVKNKPELKVFFYLSISLMVLSLLYAQSRGAFITLPFIAGVYLLQFGSKAAKRLSFPFLIVVVLVQALPQYAVRIWDIGDTQTYYSGTGAARIEAWIAGIRMFLENPLFGVGFGQYANNTPLYVLDVTMREISGLVAHNSYIEIAAETGILGLILFVLLMYYMVRNYSKAAKLFRSIGMRREFFVTYGLYLGAIGYVFGQSFISAQYRKYLWLMLGLSIAVLRISQRIRLNDEKKEDPNCAS